MSKTSAPLINLEDPNLADAEMVVLYRGVLLRLSKERVVSLLALEERWLREVVAGVPAALAAAPPPAPRKTARAEAQPDEAGGKFTDIEGDIVSHASLSYRIKRIYNYSRAAQALRPAHKNLLNELITRFDWAIPEHPNTQLEFHLREFVRWVVATDAATAARLEDFMNRYRECRYQPAASA